MFVGSLFATSLLAFSPVYAVPLKVFDCSGNMRATKEVPPSSPSEVTVDVVTKEGNPADGTRLTLTNKATGTVRTATASSGSVTFEDIYEGDWLLGTTDSSLLFSAIIVEDSIPPVIAYSGAAGGGAAGAAVAGVGINEINQGSDSSGSSTPPPPSTPLPTPVPTRDPLCPNCNPDDTPEPIDDFFSDRVAPMPTPGAAPNIAVPKKPQAPAKKSPSQRTQGTDCFISNDVEPISPFR